MRYCPHAAHAGLGKPQCPCPRTRTCGNRPVFKLCSTHAPHSAPAGGARETILDGRNRLNLRGLPSPPSLSTHRCPPRRRAHTCGLKGPRWAWRGRAAAATPVPGPGRQQGVPALRHRTQDTRRWHNPRWAAAAGLGCCTLSQKMAKRSQHRASSRDSSDKHRTWEWFWLQPTEPPILSPFRVTSRDIIKEVALSPLKHSPRGEKSWQQEDGCGRAGASGYADRARATATQRGP